MRVAYVNADCGIPTFGNKGASIHIRELVGAFRALGHHVSVLVPDLGEERGSHFGTVVPIAVPWDETGGVSGGTLPDEKRRQKERVSLSLARRMEERLVALHAEAPFDLIYERYSLWSAAGCRAAARLGVRCVVEVNAPLLLEQRKYRKLVLAKQAQEIESEVFAGAHGIVAVSNEVRRYVIERNGNPARTHVIPNGVDLARFNPAVTAAPIPANDGQGFVIGFTGSLRPWHGVAHLLEAFAILARQSDDFHLLIVGDGPKRQWVKGFAHGAGFRDRVTLTGAVAYGELPALLRRMDLAVAPYPDLPDFYFSPLKLFEYLAVGKPIVASAIGQVTSVIQDAVTGLLVRPGDAIDLAGAIMRIYREPAFGRSLGDAAAKRAHDFTWQGNARQIVALAASLPRAA